MRSSKSRSPKDEGRRHAKEQTFWQKKVNQVGSVSKLLLNKNKPTGEKEKEKETKRVCRDPSEQLECLKKALEALTHREAELSKRSPKDSVLSTPSEVEKLLKNVRSDDILCYSDGKNSLIYCPSDKGIVLKSDASDTENDRSKSKSPVKKKKSASELAERKKSPETGEKRRSGGEPNHRKSETHRDSHHDVHKKDKRRHRSRDRSDDRRHCKRDDSRHDTRDRDKKEHKGIATKWGDRCKATVNCKKKVSQESIKTQHLKAGRGRTRSDEEDSSKERRKKGSRKHSDDEDSSKERHRKGEKKDVKSRSSKASLKRTGSGRRSSRDRDRRRTKPRGDDDDDRPSKSTNRSSRKEGSEEPENSRKRSSQRRGHREKTEGGRSVSREPEPSSKSQVRRSSLKRNSPSKSDSRPTARLSGSSPYLRDSQSYGPCMGPQMGYGGGPCTPCPCPCPCPPSPCPGGPYQLSQHALMQNGSMSPWNPGMGYPQQSHNSFPETQYGPCGPCGPGSPMGAPDVPFGGPCGPQDFPAMDSGSVRFQPNAGMRNSVQRKNVRVSAHLDGGGYMETLPENSMSSPQSMGIDYSQRGQSMVSQSSAPSSILRGSRGSAMNGSSMYARSASSIGPSRPVSFSFPSQTPYPGQFPSQERLPPSASGGNVCCASGQQPPSCCCAPFCMVECCTGRTGIPSGKEEPMIDHCHHDIEAPDGNSVCAACADPEYYETGEHIHETPSPMCNYHRLLCEKQKMALAESAAELDNNYAALPVPAQPRFDAAGNRCIGNEMGGPKGRRLDPNLSGHGLNPNQLQHPVDPQMLSLLYRRGREVYLRERRKLSPEEKYAFPVLTSHLYGWRILCAYYPRKTYARRSIDFRAGDAVPMPFT